MRTLRLFLILILLLPLGLMAQTTDKKEVSRQINLNVITVKAEKKETKLQETPVAVSLIPAKKIENENILTLADLSAMIPNFFVLDYGSKLSPPVFMRGLGLRRDASPSVGLYVDGIPYLEKGSFNFDFVDVQSIEVLRGPQGTLYGRNTMGGLIKIYTQDPKVQAPNYVKTEVGNYGLFKTSIHINEPLNKKFYTVFNAMYSHHGGFFTNEFTDKKADKSNTYAGRLKLAYRPNNDFKATLSFDLQSSKQLGYAYAAYDIATKATEPVNYNKESSYDRDQLSIGFNVEHTTDNVVYSSSTSYQLLDDRFFIDQDFSPTDLYFIDQNRKHHTVYQEFNIHSKKDSKIDWLFGTMLFKQFTDKAVDVTYGAPFIAMINLPYDTYSYLKSYNQPTSGFAVYGQTTIPAGEFEFTAGARLDLEKAELGYTYSTFGNGTESVKPGFDSDLNFTQFIPKFSIVHKPCDFFTSYFSITKGFKAGGFNSSFETDEARTFDPEQSWNYELGLKSTWFDNKLTVNVSAFFIDISNQQVLQPVPSGQGAYVRNAAESTSKGIEIEVNAYVSNNWQLWTAFGYNDAKFDKYTNQKDLVLDGNFIPNVPKFTFSAGSNQTFDLNTKIAEKMHFNVNYQLIGKQYWEETNAASQNTYGIVNTKLTFENKVIDFGIWAKNIFNTDYHAFYFTTQGKAFVQSGKPAQFSIFAKIKF